MMHAWRAAAAALACLAAGCARTAPPTDGPIVLVSIDTLRADHLPAIGERGRRSRYWYDDPGTSR